MDARTLTGLVAVAAVVATVLVGMYGFLDTTAFNVFGDYETPMFASVGVVVLFVAVLSIVAIRADVRGRNTYW